MHISQFLEAICAIHLTSYVESPFQDRGGMMIVGPPGVLKTTAVEILDKQYADAVSVSDINAQGLIALRDAISGGAIRTLILPELRKLYERHPTTAQNVEGTLRAMVAEGFSNASFEDQRITTRKARVTIVGAITPDTFRSQFARWDASGFHRRFLWPVVSLENPQALEDAVIEWQRINFNLPSVPRAPLSGESIPNLTTTEERRMFGVWAKYQPGGSHTVQMQLLAKMCSVLRWWTQQAKVTDRDPMLTLEAFSKALGKEGALIGFKEKVKGKRKRVVRKVSVQVAGRTLANERWDARRKRKGRNK